TGAGTGLAVAGRAHKLRVICEGIERNQPDPADPLDVLAKLGGFEIAGL
ncbi:MAG: nicotinate-nucleotide--dimethylbenzimidazole phosphoribosyltransferase, partial [Gammaproteobacteria bacterium]|nr:nicotinate-nucleotide--dimethylbenzimidazole phosphoribosyltransferase [Gammaproteobacteria bacterium]NIT64853.1 nicotinate-nucleotide--dimethylbenzimidazole phosphoribosyltransferase [Gammaproteobacteria bacterium]NIV20593.1 nicotinate-nucleotide--dimethylbenzimidazole phosphoribosyltransferase [Gammaproteobacteria bacterium]NIY33433.1 nicotinate-nucleotide--dimethylbenzimidazole phosphoribosyltransferase [Gammaproteobacteria bacterium]